MHHEPLQWILRMNFPTVGMNGRQLCSQQFPGMDLMDDISWRKVTGNQPRSQKMAGRLRIWVSFASISGLGSIANLDLSKSVGEFNAY